MRQSGYIKDILHRFSMTDSKSVITPLEPGIKLDREIDSQNDEKEVPPYEELVGTLMYLAVCTRPDIAYAASYLSQFCTCYGDSHWRAAKRVLRYLKGTASVGIAFSRTSRPFLEVTSMPTVQSTEDLTPDMPSSWSDAQYPRSLVNKEPWPCHPLRPNTWRSAKPPRKLFT